LIKKLLLTILLLSLSLSSYAATEFVCAINKTGEDYNTLALWEAAMDDCGDITDGTVFTGDWDNQSGSDIADAAGITWDSGASNGTLIHMTSTQYLIDVSAGTLDDDDTVSDGTNSFQVNGTPDSTIIVAECYDDDGDMTAGCTINGFTADSSNYVKITAPVGERHDGTAGSGVVIDVSSSPNQNPINIQDNNVVIEWLEITGWSGAAGYQIRYGIVAGTAFNPLIQYNIVHDSGSNANNKTQHGIRWDRAGRAYNNIVYNVGGHGIREGAGYGGNVYIYGNTVYGFNEADDNSDGIKVGNSSPGAVKNNLVIELGTTGGLCFSGWGSTTHDYNASSDSSATGTNSLDSGDASPPSTSDFVSVTAGSEDLHLVAGAVEVDEGVDLSGTFTLDIDNTTRPATWDIGADEYVGVPAVTTQFIMVN
jgi:hypothetical protein